MSRWLVVGLGSSLVETTLLIVMIAALIVSDVTSSSSLRLVLHQNGSYTTGRAQDATASI